MVKLAFTIGACMSVCMACSQVSVDGRVIDAITLEPVVHARIKLLTIQSISPKIRVDQYWIGEKYAKDTVRWMDTTYSINQLIYSDSNGYFSFKNVTPGYYTVRSFYKIQETIRASGARYEGGEAEQVQVDVNCDNITLPDFRLGIFCRYDLTKLFTRCPLCKQSDAVYKIVFGLQLFGFEEYKKPRHYYNGFCETSRCDPTKDV